MSKDALSPQQFFHGTRHDIRGGVVRPANTVGVEPSPMSLMDPGKLSSGDHAFAVRNDEDYAWQAASDFHRGEGRPRVYEVEPASRMFPGPHNPRLDEWASPTGFKVKQRIDIMPGRQGTFPDINWNTHANRGYVRNRDLNHPSDEDIETPLGEQHRARQDHFFSLQVTEPVRMNRGRELPVLQPHGRRYASLLDETR